VSMSNTAKSGMPLLYLAWESPWPPHDGGRMRSLGFLRELSKEFEVEAIILTRQPLTTEQEAALRPLVRRITRIPLRDVSPWQKLAALGMMLYTKFPYHSAVLEVSLRVYPELRYKIKQFPGVVFAGPGHWGTLVRDQPAPNWILNQFDQDIEFWRVYASQTSSYLVRNIALINRKLSIKHFPQIYRNIRRIISVCEEDRQLTLEFAPSARIDIIENGVDCSFYVPDKITHGHSPRLLFTGTSAARNMIALHWFVNDVFPLIQVQSPSVELLVGGNFTAPARAEFSEYDAVRFTGRVDDIRPAFNQSDVYIAPFAETHGSKLKVAEAMAMGMALVSTPQGARGFPLVDGESVLIARDGQQFANQVIRLLRDSALRAELGSAARAVAVSTIDWSILGKRIRAIVQSVQDDL
jgi:polysaccharide biosynthesis protein PslH